MEIEGDLEPAILGNCRARDGIGEIVRSGRRGRESQSGEQSEQDPPDGANNRHGRFVRMSGYRPATATLCGECKRKSSGLRVGADLPVTLLFRVSTAMSHTFDNAGD